jgi:uncharacterized membrane protein
MNIATISKAVRLCGLLITSTALSIAAVAIPQGKALAWFKICNQSSEKTHAAFAYSDEPDNRSRRSRLPQASVLLSSWVSQGWWALNPGQCAEVYPHELWRRNRYYYIYAEKASGRGTWSGNQFFCVARGTAFTIGNADMPISTSNVINGCFIEEGNRGANISILGFKEVNIGGGRTQNFTFNLR